MWLNVRRLSLAVVLGLGVWLFWPASGDAEGTGRDRRASTKKDGRDAEHVLRMALGPHYQPGTIPFGVGKKLRGAQEVADAFEKLYPDTRIDIVNVPTVVREYLVTQLSSGKAPDVVPVNVEDVWIDVHKGWYVPLDAYLEAPNPFVRERDTPETPGYRQWWDMFKYQAISRGKAAPDGRMYCISLDMIETAIFYNKDIFAEVGVTVPETWPEFIDVMAKLKQAGHLPLIMVLDWFSDWAVDLFFDQLYYDILPGIDLVQDPKREPYLEGYLDWDEVAFLFKQGFFTARDPRWREIWPIMREFRQYCSPNLMPAGTVDFLRDFMTGNGVMIWFTSQLTHPLLSDRDLDFEWGVFYLPPFTRQTSPYAPDPPEPMCVIGGSATQLEVTNSAYSDTGDPNTSTRLKRVIAFLQFLTLPENCERVVNEYPSLLPNIVGVPVLPVLEPFERILERRYTTTKITYTFDLKFTEIQRRALELYLSDAMSLDEFLEWEEGNFETAVRNVLIRKNIDMDRLQRKWDELAPVRAQMEDLPHAP